MLLGYINVLFGSMFRRKPCAEDQEKQTQTWSVGSSELSSLLGKSQKPADSDPGIRSAEPLLGEQHLSGVTKNQSKQPKTVWPRDFSV